MSGDKWESVNYAMQLVTALLDESDRLFVVRQNGSFANSISTKDKQTSINTIQGFSRNSSSGHDPVIQEAVNLMKNAPSRKKVMLFYGDGIWGTAIRKACSDLLRNYIVAKPELYFLKVEDNTGLLSRTSDFENEMSSIGLFNVIPTNPAISGELTTNLQNISKKIARAEERNADFSLAGSDLSFEVKFPLKKLLIIYQKETTRAISDIQVQSIDSKQDIEIRRKLEMGSENLKGKYFELKDKGGLLIRKGQTIKVRLDREIDKDYVLVIPVVAAELVSKFNSDFLTSDPSKNEYFVCEDTRSVELISFMNDINGKRIGSMDDVMVSANNGARNFRFTIQKGEASGKISLLGDTTYISVEARHHGYFHQKDRIFTVIKKKCRPTKDTATIDLGKIPFLEFNRSSHCVGITYMINDDVIAPANYSLKVDGMPLGITCTIDSSGNSFLVCFKKSQLVCDCLVPSGLITGTFKAISKHQEVMPAIKTWEFEITKESNIFRRCKKCLTLLITLISILTYLYGIIKKPRFDRTAKLEVYEMNRTAAYAPHNKKPRKRLPSGFVSRFLVPFKPETKIVDGMKIIASTSKSTILIAKESMSDRMSKNGEPVNPKAKKDLRVFRNNTIEIEKTATVTTVYTYKVK